MTQITMQAVSRGARPTQMPSFKQVVMMTLPQMGLMFCHLAIAMTDLWVAGRIDATVLASLGVVTQVFALLMVVMSIVSSGCLASITQALGAGLESRARRYVGLIMLLAAGFGCIVALVGLLCLPLILNFLADAPQLRPVVKTFVVAYCLQLPFYYTMIMFNSVFRAYTLVMLPMFTLLIVALLNVGGSLGFGLGMWGLPNYSYAGVAWSTFGSTVIGLGLNIRAALKHGILRRNSFAPWSWNRLAMPYLFKVGSPMAIGQLIGQSGTFIILFLVAKLHGDTVSMVAGLTVGTRVVSIVYYPMQALVMSVAIFSGHLLGARLRAEVYRFGRNAAIAAVLGLSVLGTLLFLFRGEAAGLITPDPAVREQARLYLLFACIGIPFTVCSAVLGGCFYGTGATLQPCIAACISTWLVRVPLSVGLCFGMGMGVAGIYAAMVISWMGYTVYAIYFYRSKKWLEYGQRKQHNSFSKAQPA